MRKVSAHNTPHSCATTCSIVSVHSWHSLQLHFILVTQNWIFPFAFPFFVLSFHIFTQFLLDFHTTKSSSSGIFISPRLESGAQHVFLASPAICVAAVDTTHSIEACSWGVTHLWVWLNTHNTTVGYLSRLASRVDGILILTLHFISLKGHFIHNWRVTTATHALGLNYQLFNIYTPVGVSLSIFYF